MKARYSLCRSRGRRRSIWRGDPRPRQRLRVCQGCGETLRSAVDGVSALTILQNHFLMMKNWETREHVADPRFGEVRLPELLARSEGAS